MKIYRRDPFRQGFRKWLGKVVETSIKSSILLTLPIPATAFACAVWYFGLYTQETHFHDELEDNVILSWISMFGILYSLMAAVVLGAVFNEYKQIRMAIKCHDIATFMSLRDEDVSPIIHTIMTILALAVLATFMGLRYPDAISGIGVIGATTYIFALLYWVIREVDDPFSGIWFIKHVPDGWLKHDPRVWRDTFYSKTVTKTDEGERETTVTTTIESTEVPTAEEKAA